MEPKIESLHKQKLCLNCGKQLKKGQYKFCCCSCSVTYNNKNRKHSATTKEKIRNSVLKYQKAHPERYKKSIKIEQLNHDRRKICPTCGKEFIAKKLSTIYCSPKCVHNSLEYREKIRQKQLARVKQGIHSGWRSRNVVSYPEQFWIKVLQNNNIIFEREKHIGKYFLDFVIHINNKLIDLEIDGKQHKYQDRRENDKIRDQFLINNGYIIYRIDWNEINSSEGKILMKNKISQFLLFINNTGKIL